MNLTERQPTTTMYRSYHCERREIAHDVDYAGVCVVGDRGVLGAFCSKHRPVPPDKPQTCRGGPRFQALLTHGWREPGTGGRRSASRQGEAYVYDRLRDRVIAAYATETRHARTPEGVLALAEWHAALLNG